jgi:hypothetical protein
VKAVDLIRKGWCQLDLARDTDGDACSVRSQHAVCWCSIGALLCAYEPDSPPYHSPQYEEAKKKLQAVILSETGITDIAVWNDSSLRDKSDVIRVFELADI